MSARQQVGVSQCATFRFGLLASDGLAVAVAINEARRGIARGSYRPRAIRSQSITAATACTTTAPAPAATASEIGCIKVERAHLNADVTI